MLEWSVIHHDKTGSSCVWVHVRVATCRSVLAQLIHASARPGVFEK